MTERNLSREQAIDMHYRDDKRGMAIAVHLAKVMGLKPIWCPHNGGIQIERNYPSTDRYDVGMWNPHHDRAQWAEVIEWAAVNGLQPQLDAGGYSWAGRGGNYPVHSAKHDNTPAGVRDAALEAIARATGWQGMEGE